MISIVPAERVGRAQERMQLLVFYTDFPAGVRAKQLTDQIIILAGYDRKTFVQFWKLDSIPSIGPLKEIIAKDASTADALFMASSSPGQDEPMLSAWMNLLSATNSQRLVRGLLVGVLGDETTNATETDQVSSMMFLFARRAQLDFFWQKYEIKTTTCPAWIADPFKQLVKRKVRVSNQRLADMAALASARVRHYVHLEYEYKSADVFRISAQPSGSEFDIRR